MYKEIRKAHITLKNFKHFDRTPSLTYDTSDFQETEVSLCMSPHMYKKSSLLKSTITKICKGKRNFQNERDKLEIKVKQVLTGTDSFHL